MEGQDGQIVASDCIAADIEVKRVMAQDDYLSVKVEGVVLPWPKRWVSARFRGEMRRWRRSGK